MAHEPNYHCPSWVKHMQIVVYRTDQEDLGPFLVWMEGDKVELQVIKEENVPLIMGKTGEQVERHLIGDRVHSIVGLPGTRWRVNLVGEDLPIDLSALRPYRERREPPHHR